MTFVEERIAFGEDSYGDETGADDRYGGPEVLQIAEAELRGPGAGEAPVRLEATGVSFAEQQNYRDATGDPMAPVYERLHILEELGKTNPSRLAAQVPAFIGTRGGRALRAQLSAAFGSDRRAAPIEDAVAHRGPFLIMALP